MAKSITTKIDQLAAVFGYDRRLSDALAAWQALPEVAQRQLAYEVAESRRNEILAVYPDAISVGHGYRKAGQARTIRGKLLRRGKVTGEPCVVVTVRKKWPKSRKGGKAGHLPKYLLAFCEAPSADHSNLRQLCIVPTDVRGADELIGAPRNGVALVAARSDDDGIIERTGTIACAVQVAGEPSLFGLSCYHVMVPEKLYDENPEGLTRDGRETIVVDADQSIVGKLWTGLIGNLIVRQGAYSLDAALCKMANLDVLRSACGSVRPIRYTLDPSRVPQQCGFITSRGALRGRVVAEHAPFSGVAYMGADGPLPKHYRVLEFEMDAQTTIGGDSGCAVLNGQSEEFVGMHIGGIDGTLTVFVLPSYELFLSQRWTQAKSPFLAPPNW